MEFARKQLEKYGWEEGKGLGRNEDGISEALKGKKKSTRSGLGHSFSEEYTDKWWNKVYNDALNNIQLDVDEDGSLNKISTVTNKGAKKNRSQEMPSKYAKKFVRKEILQSGNTKALTSKGDEQNASSGDDSPKSEKKSKGRILTDEELFAACEGRTAHKGARHGLTASGKLDRIKKQEEEFSRRLRSNDATKTQNETSNNEADSVGVCSKAKKPIEKRSDRSTNEDNRKEEKIAMNSCTDLVGNDVSELKKQPKSTKKKGEKKQTYVNVEPADELQNTADLSEESINSSRKSKRKKTSNNLDKKIIKVLDKSDSRIKINDTSNMNETSNSETNKSLTDKSSESDTVVTDSDLIDKKVTESKDKDIKKDCYVKISAVDSKETCSKRKKISVEEKYDAPQESVAGNLDIESRKENNGKIIKLAESDLDIPDKKHNTTELQNALNVVNIDKLSAIEESLAKPNNIKNGDVLELSDDSSNDSTETLILKPAKKLMLNPMAAQYKNMFSVPKSDKPVGKNNNFTSKIGQPSQMPKQDANDEGLILNILQNLREKLAIQRLAQEKANLRVKKGISRIVPSGVILELSDDDEDVSLNAPEVPILRASNTQMITCNLSDSTDSSESEDGSDESCMSDDIELVKKIVTTNKTLSKSVVISDSSDEDEVVFSGYEVNESQNYIPQKPSVLRKHRPPQEEFDPMQFVECEVIIETKNNENVNLHDSDVCEVTEDEIKNGKSQRRLKKILSKKNSRKVRTLEKKIDIAAVLKKSGSLKKVEKSLKKVGFRKTAVDSDDESAGTDVIVEEIDLSTKEVICNNLNKTDTSDADGESSADDSNDVESVSKDQRNKVKSKKRESINDIQHKSKCSDDVSQTEQRKENIIQNLNTNTKEKKVIDTTHSTQEHTTRKIDDINEPPHTKCEDDIETSESKNIDQCKEKYPKRKRRKENVQKILTDDKPTDNLVDMDVKIAQNKGRNKPISPKHNGGVEMVDKLESNRNFEQNEELKKVKNKNKKKKKKENENENVGDSSENKSKLRKNKEVVSVKNFKQSKDNGNKRKEFNKEKSIMIALDDVGRNIQATTKVYKENINASIESDQNQTKVKETREKTPIKNKGNVARVKNSKSENEDKIQEGAGKSQNNEIEILLKIPRKGTRNKHAINNLTENIEATKRDNDNSKGETDKTHLTGVHTIESTRKKNRHVSDDSKLNAGYKKCSDSEKEDKLQVDKVQNQNKRIRKGKRSRNAMENLSGNEESMEKIETKDTKNCVNDITDKILSKAAKNNERAKKKLKSDVESLVDGNIEQESKPRNDEGSDSIVKGRKRTRIEGTKNEVKENVDVSASDSPIKELALTLQPTRFENAAENENLTEISSKSKRSKRNNLKGTTEVGAERISPDSVNIAEKKVTPQKTDSSALISLKTKSPKSDKVTKLKRKLDCAIQLSTAQKGTDGNTENKKSSDTTESPMKRMKRQNPTVKDTTIRERNIKETNVLSVKSADKTPTKKSKRQLDKSTEKPQYDSSKISNRKLRRK